MLKAFISEVGSTEMSALLVSTEGRFKTASALVTVELHSAVRRRQLLGDISKTEADLALLSIQQELGRLSLLALTQPVLGLAGEVIERQRLRTLDAIQLATALDAKRASSAADKLQFVASDKKLLLAAEAEGLSTWNPASAP